MPYTEHEAFKTHLANFTDTFLDFLDPSLSQIAKTFHVESLIKKHGGIFIDALGQVNLIATLNTLLKLTIPLLNKGTWQGTGLEQTFTAVPFEYFTKIKEEEQELAFKRQQHEDIRQETERVLQTLTHDFSGISSLGVDSFMPRPTQEHIERVMLSDDFLDHWRLGAWLLIVHASQEILKFICWLLGKAKIEETSYALYERTKTMYFKQTVRPLESVIAKIIHTA